MPRKTRPDDAAAPGRPQASMRPRPDAAENGERPQDAAVEANASMRPRPDAAENNRRDRSAGAVVVLASMRPRPDAAENRGG